ncbi:hypothetical protein SteCoe_6146 [Stentor coeruleus]|uniref:Uncharacterized protein n=1 Tax=Stentor coeruleus TaxID=5963 RepID=A0A1R2CQS9_9CILI|nr:hypothetical protein SteCoe_6146 [Stentor coeruleus]
MDPLRDDIIGRVNYLPKSCLLLDKFLFKIEPLLNFRCYELRNLFYQTITELLLSEIEVVAWLIYIEKIGIEENLHNIKEFLIFVGLHAKIHLGSDVRKFLERFGSKNPRIIEKFEAWSNLNKQSTYISTVELGKKYRQLSAPKGISRINYNFYLNDILRSCTIYQKQTIDSVFYLNLELEKSPSKKNIFEIKKRPKIVEDQEYNLKEFDRIDI